VLRRGGDAQKGRDLPARRLVTAQQPPSLEPQPPANGTAASAPLLDQPAPNSLDEPNIEKNRLDGNAFAPPPDWGGQGKRPSAKSKSLGKRTGKLKVMNYDLKLTAEVAKTKGPPKEQTGSSPKPSLMLPERK
jgi:hypothetical protein